MELISKTQNLGADRERRKEIGKETIVIGPMDFLLEEEENHQRAYLSSI
jgi:hypothetical protein